MLSPSIEPSCQHPTLSSDLEAYQPSLSKPAYPLSIELTSQSSSSSTCHAQSSGTHNEGGIRAWLTVAGSFLVNYASFGLINTFGFFQDYYQTHLLSNTPPSTIALIGTIQIALMNSLSTVSGALCDAYGIKWLYVFAGLGTSTSLIALSFIPGVVWQIFLTQGLVMGISIGFGAQPALAVVGHLFKKHRGLAMGVVMAGAGAGGVIFPIVFSKLVPVIGFAWALRVAALKTAACYTISLSISITERPENSKGSKSSWLPDFNGFRDVRYCVVCAGAWVSQLGLWVPTYFIESYCAKIYPTMRVSSYLLPIFNTTGLVGTITGGVLGDKIGYLNLFWPVDMFLGFLCLSLWFHTRSIDMLIAFVCIYGFCSGIFATLLPAVVSQISPDEKLGARIGAFYSIIAIASLIGTPIGGALIRQSTTEEYQGLILYAGVALVVGALILFGARLLHGRNLRAKW